MSTLSPPAQAGDLQADPFDIPSAVNRSSGSSVAPMPPNGGLVWQNGGPMLRMEDAVVETVVTRTTRTTTSFPPIPLSRIPMPEAIPQPNHLAPERYPLALEPSPEDMRVFAINIGGRRVVVQEDNTLAPEAEVHPLSSGPGWTRTLLGGSSRKDSAERFSLLKAVTQSKGKDVRKRPHNFSNPDSRQSDGDSAAPTPPISAEPGSRPRRSPPRKKIRGLEDLNIPQDASTTLLSPLPSPEHEVPPSRVQSVPSSPPPIGSGLELSALFSLPSLVSHFEELPDKLQQQVLMHLLRRSRMPTIQRVHSFAGLALKRDFITHLPHEIAVQILQKVDSRSLATATRVSKRWKNMIDSERGVWEQRLIDDGLFCGHGVEEEEERLVRRRTEALHWKMRTRPSKASTPTEDDTTATTISYIPEIDPPVPLKHVYRRRYTDAHTWLNNRPEHVSFPGHGTNVVTCLQFDADKIVSASDDHSINVYDTVNGNLRRRLDGHEGGVWALEYKGSTLVSGSTDRTVRIWDLDTLSEVHVFHGHTSTVRCLKIVEPVFDEATGEYQPPCPMIVTGSRDASLRVWKLPRKGEPSFTRGQFEGDTTQVSPAENPWHVHHLEGHTSAVRALAAHGRICVSGSYDCTVRVWDIVTGQCKHVLVGHEQRVYSIVYDEFRMRCASGSMDNTVKVWDVVTGECLYTLTGHTSLVGLLGNSPNFLVSAAADSSIRVWDANTCELKHTLASHGGAITCFHHDETKVVSGSDGTLKLWDIRTGRYVRDLVIGISSVWQLSFNGNLLVAASNRGGTTVFDVFNFGKNSHPSGIDDEELDNLVRPPWLRPNPREPQEYQVDDIDGVELTSPRDTLGNPLSPEESDRYTPENSYSRQLAYDGFPANPRNHHDRAHAASRRSTRLAARSGGDDRRRASHPERERRRASRHDRVSPTARAGPSHAPYGTYMADESFTPIFDEEGDADMEDDFQEEAI